MDNIDASAKIQDQRSSLPSASRNTVRWLLGVLLALAVAYFLYRGPIRAWGHTIDLSTFYSASRAWWDGSNPYDGSHLTAIFLQAGGVVPPTLSVNPPETFVLLAPLSWLPWTVAEATWTVLNVGMVAVCLWLVTSLAQIDVRKPGGLLFLIFAIALAPFHTSISQGQLTIADTVLILGILWGQVHSRPVLSGLCLALAISLKPQMAVLFFALLLFRGQWKALLWAAGAMAVITIIAVGRMAIAGVDWLPTLQGNLTALTQGGTLDPSGPTAFLMINLQVLLHVPLADQGHTVLDLLTYGSVAVAGAFFLWRLRQRNDREVQLLLFAGCAVLNLLVIYNRIYGATLLILPLAWAFSPMRPATNRVEAATVSAATLVFLVPGAAALGTLSLPASLQFIASTTLWQLVMLHEIIGLLVILAALLVAAGRTDNSRRTSPARPIDSTDDSIVLPNVKPVKPAAM